MGKSPKRGWTWVYTPGKDPRTMPSDAVKAEVERAFRELIDTTLRGKYIQPPPKKPQFNYVTDLSTRWHGRFFYLIATYACPFKDALSPTFDQDFARLERTATGRFNVAFLRHTGKWHTLFPDQTLADCLTAVRDDPWFQL